MVVTPHIVTDQGTEDMQNRDQTRAIKSPCLLTYSHQPNSTFQMFYNLSQFVLQDSEQVPQTPACGRCLWLKSHEAVKSIVGLEPSLLALGPQSFKNLVEVSGFMCKFWNLLGLAVILASPCANGQPWTIYLTSLCLSILISMVSTRLPTSQG